MFATIKTFLFGTLTKSVHLSSRSKTLNLTLFRSVSFYLESYDLQMGRSSLAEGPFYIFSSVFRLKIPIFTPYFGIFYLFGYLLDLFQSKNNISGLTFRKLNFHHQLLMVFFTFLLNFTLSKPSLTCF